MLLTFLLPIAGVGFIYVSLCFALIKWQNRFIFLPSSKLKKTPHDYDLDYEEIWISVREEQLTSERGKKISEKIPERIHSWWIPAPLNSQENGDRRTILFLHGNAFNIGANLEQAEVFHRLGLSVFMVDYRGYGQSKGQFPNESQVYEDTQISLDYLVEHKNISPKEIIVYGHSLGGAIAIELATKNSDLAALILQGCFTSLRDMIDYDKIFTVFPVDLLLNHYFDSINKIAALEMPMLFIHGNADRRIPEWMSHRLYETAQTSLKDLYIVEEGDHDHIVEIGGEAYYRKLEEFIQKLRSLQTINN